MMQIMVSDNHPRMIAELPPRFISTLLQFVGQERAYVVTSLLIS
jgi:hypothetical protein